MKKLLYSFVILLVLTALVTTPVLASYTISPRLLAGQTMFAGVVKTTGYNDYLHLEIQVRGGAGWCMTASQVHVGLSLAEFPQNSGGAIPGQFDYKQSYGSCITTATYNIPIAGKGWFGQRIYIAVHAVVNGPNGLVGETAWAVNCGNLEGGQFPGNNWSAYYQLPANAWYDLPLP